MKYIKNYYDENDYNEIIEYHFKKFIEFNFLNINRNDFYNIFSDSIKNISNNIINGKIKSDKKLFSVIRKNFINLIFTNEKLNYLINKNGFLICTEKNYLNCFKSNDYKNNRFFCLKL